MRSTDVLTPTPTELPRLKLVVVAGPDFGAELVLDSGTYRVGTESTSDLVLQDSSVSRTHLLAAVMPDGVALTDNRSTNGSFCEGMRFTALTVKLGAVVRVGRTVLKLLSAEKLRPAVPPSERDRFGALRGRSLAMRELFAVLERLAPTDVDVLIVGETGTGKELCARALHEASTRAAGPFVVCDVAALSSGLAEAELFGHVKGAFPGGGEERPGLLERAAGGTVFLDEVGGLPLELQAKLLRLLESRELRRVGADSYARIDVRVLAATQREPQQELEQGRLRQDLYYRLASATVRLPPLRDRLEDIPLLIDTLLEQLGRPPGQLTEKTRALLADYRWPGNVRELRNVVEGVVALGELPALPADPGGRGPGLEVGFHRAKEAMVGAFEKDYLSQLLEKCGGNLSKAARVAGLDRTHLYRLLKKHQLWRAGDEP